MPPELIILLSIVGATRRFEPLSCAAAINFIDKNGMIRYNNFRNNYGLRMVNHLIAGEEIMNLSVLTSYNYQTQDSSEKMFGGLLLYAIGFFIGIIIAAAISYSIAKKFENVAKLKGYGSEMHSFAMCFWLGIIGYIYVAALPKINTKEESDREHGKILIREGKAFICYNCHTPVMKGTIKCPGCGRAFNWDETSENE